MSTINKLQQHAALYEKKETFVIENFVPKLRFKQDPVINTLPKRRNLRTLFAGRNFGEILYLESQSDNHFFAAFAAIETAHAEEVIENAQAGYETLIGMSQQQEAGMPDRGGLPQARPQPRCLFLRRSVILLEGLR